MNILQFINLYILFCISSSFDLKMKNQKTSHGGDVNIGDGHLFGSVSKYTALMFVLYFFEIRKPIRNKEKENKRTRNNY